MATGVQLSTDGIIPRNKRSHGVSLSTDGVVSIAPGPVQYSGGMDYILLKREVLEADLALQEQDLKTFREMAQNAKKNIFEILTTDRTFTDLSDQEQLEVLKLILLFFAILLLMTSVLDTLNHLLEQLRRQRRRRLK